MAYEGRVSQAGMDMLTRIGALQFLEKNGQELIQQVLDTEPQTLGAVYEAAKEAVTNLDNETEEYQTLKAAAEADGDVFFGPTLLILSEHLGDYIIQNFMEVDQ